MNDRIQEIRNRLAEAIPGPWVYREVDQVVYTKSEIDGVKYKMVADVFGGNGKFIANAPDDIDYLLSEVERLQRENEAMKEALKWTRKRFEEEWTYEPGVGEAVDDILNKFDTALSHLKG